jgi:hypothetical protein
MMPVLFDQQDNRKYLAAMDHARLLPAGRNMADMTLPRTTSLR